MSRGETEAPKWQNREKLFQCKLKMHLKLFPLEELPNCWRGCCISEGKTLTYWLWCGKFAANFILHRNEIVKLLTEHELKCCKMSTKFRKKFILTGLIDDERKSVGEIIIEITYEFKIYCSLNLTISWSPNFSLFQEIWNDFFSNIWIQLRPYTRYFKTKATTQNVN